MAGDSKKTKTTPAAKTEATPAAKSEAAPAAKSEAPAAKSEASAAKGTPDTAPAKTDGGEKAGAAPASYSRGEGQKPVTQAYKDNWNAIFAKKKRPARSKKR